MSSFEHFSHDHPLIFSNEKNIDEEINRDHFCHICSLPILLSSFYSCSVTSCKYFLHEPCALLPRQIRNPWYSRDHLDLVKHEETCDCTRCDQECKNLHYCDRHRFDNYDSLHPMCGASMEIKSKHKSHPLHPLVAVCKESSARCDACGRKQNGYFFSCQPCNFWIHVDCTLLPRFVKCTNHSHPLILSYSIDRVYIRRCMICDEKVSSSMAYLCGDCRRYAHLSCVADNMTETKVEIIDLPFDDLDALWSWTIQKLQELKIDEGNSTYDHNQLHDDHGLILYNDDDHGINSKINSSAEPYISQELVCCNVCIQPIYPPFYACPQSHVCRFHLHRQCSELPFRVNYPIVSNKAQELRTWSTEESLCSLFCCFLCGLPGNGLSYYYDSNIKDIACFSAAKFIKHESHRQHVLYLSNFQDQQRTMNCCPVLDVRFWNAYYCVDCDFGIHVHCALLPKRVKHKFDVHPLNLITTSIIKDDMTNSSDNLCEFCEEDIDTRFWYYGCEECNNLFHIKCIPSVGYLSKVKFANSITVPCHPHRVTFVRMLGYGSQTCGYCKEIIQGFVDDMAFHCSECDFWMHFRCAEKCTGTKKFKMREPRTIR